MARREKKRAGSVPRAIREEQPLIGVAQRARGEEAAVIIIYVVVSVEHLDVVVGDVAACGLVLLPRRRYDIIWV